MFESQFDLDIVIVHATLPNHETKFYKYFENMFHNQCKAITIAALHLLKHDKVHVFEEIKQTQIRWKFTTNITNYLIQKGWPP